MADRFRAMPGPGESYSEVILRIAAGGCGKMPLAGSLGHSHDGYAVDVIRPSAAGL